MNTITVTDFPDWRRIARELLLREQSPADVRLRENDGQRSLFDEAPDSAAAATTPTPTAAVSRRFLQMAETVSYHRDPERWNLLYEILWRITHGEPKLLEITTDDSVYRFLTMEKAVRRDSHKMKAFVRFRKVVRDEVEHFIAWHRPDHRIVRRVAPFFARRFKAMNWTILTPAESVVWDQHELQFGPGVARSEAPESDELESLWLTYYGSIFNPARIKTDMMKSEMPVRHWPTLPETRIIDDLLQDAPQRVQQMVDRSEGFQHTATHLIETLAADERTLPALQQLATQCQACDLYHNATQTVFGEGPPDAELVLIGEQPGDQEDLQGKPFVGPAGQLLDTVLQELGMARSQLYVTNVVKHFKHTEQNTATGKRRLHAKPSAREIRCCRPWMDAELKQLRRAKAIVCLGATAAKALLGPSFSVSQRRGQLIKADSGPPVIATWHPAAILRMPDGALRRQRRTDLMTDLAFSHSVVTSQS